MSSIWSEEAGHASSPVVVMIHGSMDRSAGMLKLSRRLDDRFRVLRYDRRGYGRSQPHEGPFDMPDQLDDLFVLLAGRRAVLVGHSYGGNIALAAAVRAPSQIAGVAAYETPLSWEPWWPGTTAGSTAIQNGDDPELAAEAFLRRMLGDARWEALTPEIRAARRAQGPAMVGELRDLRANAPWVAGEVRVPVVAAYGTLGQAHHQRGMHHVASSIEGSQLVELEGCRHDAPLSHPDRFCTEVVQSLLDVVGGDWA